MSVWILVSACKQQVMELAGRGLFSLGWSSMYSCQQMQDYDELKIHVLHWRRWRVPNTDQVSLGFDSRFVLGSPRVGVQQR